MAEALHRKYRPQVFSDVVGQDHIERTLMNAIDADQVSHAYLFSGPRGTGKTTTARLLAKALLCEHGPTSAPDGTCQECEDIANGVHPDVYELDAASRTGVDNVREEIITRVNYAPTRGKWKVYIIDEVHMLSTAAFNALLKTLEEPPDHVIFILCTTDPQKIPDTIHSRCQRFEFHRLSNDEIVTRLGAICVAEGVEFDGDALDLIAHRAEGGMRNALMSLEQLIAFGEGRVTVAGAEDLLGSLGMSDMAEIIQAVGKRDVATCFTWTADYVESGADLAQFARDMAEHVRNLYVMSLAGTDVALEIPEAERRQLNEELGLFGSDRLARLLGVLGDLIADMRTATNPRLAFEIALTRMVRPDSDLTLEGLAERIEALEAGHSAILPNGGNIGAAAGSSTVLPNGGNVDAAVSPGTQSASAPSGSPTEVGFAPTSETISGTSETLADASTASDFSSFVAPAAPTVSAPASTPAASAAAPPPASTPAVPASAAAPAAQGDLAGLLSNPAALQRAWMSATTAIKKEKQAFAAMLVGVHARPAQDGQGIVIEFPASNPISLSMAQKPEMQELLAKSLQAAAGFAVPFELRSAEASSAATPAPAPSGSSIEGGFAPTNETISGTSETLADSSTTSGPSLETDEVPIDAYEGVPFEPDTEPANEPAVSASVAPVTVAAEPATSSEPAEPAEPATFGADDLSKMFSDGMGSSIVFEEVDE